jgi:hypothetical protein
MWTKIMGLVSGEDDEDGMTARRRNSYCFTDLAGTIWLLSCSLVLGTLAGGTPRLFGMCVDCLWSSFFPFYTVYFHRYLELLRNFKLNSKDFHELLIVVFKLD